MVTNVFPLPGLKEVVMKTSVRRSLPVMNSRLVRSTRKASLMTLRLPSRTTMPISSSLRWRRGTDSSFFFLGEYSGSSPMNGTESLSRSLRPRMRVLVVSSRKKTAMGMPRPRTTATSSILAGTGVVGAAPPVGGVISRVLYAVKACDSSFSSRFCSRNRYRASFTFCWRSTDSRYLAWSGVAAMRSVACRSCPWRAVICVSSITMWLSREVTIALRIAVRDWSMSTTKGLDEELFATRLLRCSSTVLYSDIWPSMLPLSMPVPAGSSWKRLASLVR